MSANLTRAAFVILTVDNPRVKQKQKTEKHGKQLIFEEKSVSVAAIRLI